MENVYKIYMTKEEWAECMRLYPAIREKLAAQQPQLMLDFETAEAAAKETPPAK